jgi:polyketide cyclase/dehydrase/lipid transport protein
MMKKESVSELIHQPCETVFDLLHDYDRRLQWDTLLRKACLLHGAARADVGVQSLCAGKWSTGGIPIISEYITFQRPEFAAVKMVNDPPLFKSFAATIRHTPLDNTRSKITYTYHFEAKPRWLAWLLEPVMNFKLKREMRKRLGALKGFLERG